MSVSAMQTRAPFAAGSLAVHTLAERIAREAPALEQLSTEQLEAIARAVMAEQLKDDLKGRTDLARLDYPTECATFLTHAGRSASPNTLRAYAAALNRAEAWAAMKGLTVPALKPRDEDDFAYALTLEVRAPASIRRDIAAVSSFFTFLERRFDFIRNPFRGTKARPARRAIRPASYPERDELNRILDALSPAIRAAAVMAYRGLRVGALPSLSIRGERFTARSKGKDISGEMPPEAIAAIRDAGLDSRRPFAAWTETRLADQFRYTTAKLAKAGKIAAAYSAHDLRHYFAVKEYKKTKDIVRIRDILGHASVQVTEFYLRSVGEI